MTEGIRPFVLAAGFGNRLRPLTDVLPKPAVPLLGQPLVGYALARLQQSGFERVVLNGHHLADRLQQEVDAFGARELPSMELKYSIEQPEILGTGGGLTAARPLLGDGTCAFVNGDILCDFDLLGLLQQHRRTGAAATLLVVEHPDVDRFGAIRVDGAGRVIDLAGLAGRERGAAGGKGGGEVRRGVFAGVHLVEPQVFDRLPAEGFACIVRQGYVPMMNAGQDVRAVFHEGTWNDLGTVERYLQTHVDLLDAGFPSGAAADLLAGPGGVAFGIDVGGDAFGSADAVEIASTAKLTHPVAMGAGCSIGPGAEVGPHAVLGRDVAVGERARVRQSVVWDGVELEVGDRLDGEVCFRDGGTLRRARAG